MAEKYTEEDSLLIENIPIKQGNVYTDGIFDYLILSFDIDSKTVSYILNPYDCKLFNETLDEQKVNNMSLDKFQDIVIGVYNADITK